MNPVVRPFSTSAKTIRPFALPFYFYYHEGSNWSSSVLTRLMVNSCRAVIHTLKNNWLIPKKLCLARIFRTAQWFYFTILQVGISFELCILCLNVYEFLSAVLS
jgi:hypothetical protein